MLKKLTTTLLALQPLPLPRLLPCLSYQKLASASASAQKNNTRKPRSCHGRPSVTNRADRDQYGNQNDIYAKYNVIGSNVQLLGGWRNNIDHQSDSISFYGGIGVAAPHILGISPMPRMSKDPIFLKPRPASTITSPWDGD